MKILVLSNCPLDPMLGSGKTRLMWSNGLREHGHTVDVLEPKDFELWYPKVKGRKFRQAFGAFRVVRKRLEEQSYDMIEYFGDEFWLIANTLRRRLERPMLVAHTDGIELLSLERERSVSATTTYEGMHRVFSRFTHDRFSWIAFKSAEAFVTGCDVDIDFVKRKQLYPEEWTAVIEPCLDDDYLGRSFISERKERIAFTGSWIDRKNIKLIVDVISRILRKRPNLSFHVYGAGSTRERVLKDFDAALHKQIVLYGRLTNEELTQSLSESKVYFFPSTYEGFGLALAEAMASGCAAVTTPTGYGGSLRNGVDAIVCPFNDGAAMEPAIERLLDDDAFRLNIARAGHARIQGLRWKEHVKALSDTYTRWHAKWVKTRQVSRIAVGTPA